MTATPGRLFRAVAAVVSSYGRHFGPQMAAAIAYHVLFSLFPLAIFLVSIFGIVLRDDERRERLVSWLVDNLPLSDAAGASLAEAVSGVATPASFAGLVALAGVLWSASGMMGAMRKALSTVSDPERGRPYVRGKLFDLALVLAAGLFVLVAFGLTIIVQVVEELSEEAAVALDPLDSVILAAGELTQILISLAFAFATVLLLYRFVPPVRPRLADVWPAALLAAVALQALIVGYGFYLSRFADYNLVYGSLGAAIGFLFLVYLAATILLIGAEVAEVWPRRRRSP